MHKERIVLSVPGIPRLDPADQLPSDESLRGHPIPLQPRIASPVWKTRREKFFPIPRGWGPSAPSFLESSLHRASCSTAGRKIASYGFASKGKKYSAPNLLINYKPSTTSFQRMVESLRRLGKQAADRGHHLPLSALFRRFPQRRQRSHQPDDRYLEEKRPHRRLHHGEGLLPVKNPSRSSWYPLSLLKEEEGDRLKIA